MEDKYCRAKFNAFCMLRSGIKLTKNQSGIDSPKCVEIHTRNDFEVFLPPLFAFFLSQFCIENRKICFFFLNRVEHVPC